MDVLTKNIACHLFIRGFYGEDVEIDKAYEDAEKLKNALTEVCSSLLSCNEDSEESYQTRFYDSFKKNFGEAKEQLRYGFSLCYMFICGFPQGPRFGFFVKCHGKHEFVNSILVKFENLKKGIL